jgi:hypothetical protein
MKTFEIFSESKKKGQNGRRKFKAILYQIYPDSCVDEENKVGTQYNKNGITWIKEYCEKALPSIKGMSLKCEFLDEDRTELCGHGMTDIVDGIAIFENAVVIGTFSDGYIEEVELPDGKTITACIGVGEIDSSCYNNLCKKLDENIANGIYPNGSVEILRTEDNDGIVYKYGYKDFGRIPTEFIHSGYALLGITPSDNTAKLLELNNKNKEETIMTEAEIKALVSETISTYKNVESEINECKEDCDKQIAELNATIETVTAEKNEAIANSEKIQAALDECIKERDEKCKELDELWEEMKVLREELAKAKAKERIGELNAAIATFTDEEKEYAKAEIDAFNANPVESEINSVVNKIWEGIGKKAKEDAVVAEQNSASASIEDIFSVVETNVQTAEDVNIF